MILVHRTDYWGRHIDARHSHDHEVRIKVIWTQAMDDDETYGCCRGFGRRVVRVTDYDFEEEYSGEWKLYKVSETEGRNPAHYFFKFFLVPSSTIHYGSHSWVKEHREWEYEGSIHSSSALDDLQHLLSDYLYGDGVGSRHANRYHVHVAIKMRSLDAY